MDTYSKSLTSFDIAETGVISVPFLTDLSYCCGPVVIIWGTNPAKSLFLCCSNTGIYVNGMVTTYRPGLNETAVCPQS